MHGLTAEVPVPAEGGISPSEVVTVPVELGVVQEDTLKLKKPVDNEVDRID